VGFIVGNLAVFDYPWFSIFENYETYWFIRGTFADNFGGDGEVVQGGVAYEYWVCDAD
jgi:hypothetical protein